MSHTEVTPRSLSHLEPSVPLHPTCCRHPLPLLFAAAKPGAYVVCGQLPPRPLFRARLGLLLGDSGMAGHTQGPQVVHVTAAAALVHGDNVVSMPCIARSSLCQACPEQAAAVIAWDDTLVQTGGILSWEMSNCRLIRLAAGCCAAVPGVTAGGGCCVSAGSNQEAVGCAPSAAWAVVADGPAVAQQWLSSVCCCLGPLLCRLQSPLVTDHHQPGGAASCLCVTSADVTGVTDTHLVDESVQVCCAAPFQELWCHPGNDAAPVAQPGRFILANLLQLSHQGMAVKATLGAHTALQLEQGTADATCITTQGHTAEHVQHT